MRILVLLTALFALLLVGCGGGSGHESSTISQATFQIAWPARSRDALATNLSSAQSATVVLESGAADGTDLTVHVNRDAANDIAHTDTYHVPVAVRKSVSVLTATFYAELNQGGAVVGAATATIHRQGESLELASITVSGKIASVAVVTPVTLVAGNSTVQLTAETKDAASGIVAVSAGSFHWSIVGTTAAFTLSQDGLLTPIKAGTANVTASVDGITSAAFAIVVTGPTATTIAVEANDLAYSTATGKIWATVPASGGVNANCVVSIDPETGAIGTPISVGAEPSLIAVSSDGLVGYVTVDADHSVRRVNLAGGTMGPTYSVGGAAFSDLDVVPGQPNSFVVTTNPIGGVNVAVYDDGVRRTGTGAGGYAVHFAGNSSLIYGDGHDSLFTDTIDSISITWTDQTFVNVAGFEFSNSDGLIYTASGAYIDPMTKTTVGNLSTADFLIDKVLTVGEADDRIYYVTWDVGAGKTILSFDRTTKTELRKFDTGILTGGALDIVACGNHTVAFHLFGSGVTKSVVIVRGLP